MTYFTDNPIERLMTRKPDGPPDIMPAPKGQLCYGCRRYGPGCLIACVRENKTIKMEEKTDHEAGDS